jgi:hypothetical protein
MIIDSSWNCEPHKVHILYVPTVIFMHLFDFVLGCTSGFVGDYELVYILRIPAYALNLTAAAIGAAARAAANDRQFTK